MKLFSHLVLLASLLSATSIHAKEWQLEKIDEERNIQIFTRAGTGENSALKEFKGVTQIESKLSAFIALLNNEQSACEWMHSCLEFNFISRPSERESYSYVINDAPWPVASRDMVIHSQTVQDQDSLTVKVKLTAVSDKKARDEDYVRINLLRGEWQFKPLLNNQVEVTYQVLLDPAGSIPKMLSNAMIVDTPYNTLSALQDIINTPALQASSYDFITEPES